MSDGPVSLSKVTLTKTAPAVSLSKAGSASGILRVNLNWNARPGGSGGGFLKRMMSGGGAIDLDLGCLYEYTDGSKGVVQALGDSLRDEHSFGPDPICWLDGDDRSGNNADGENLFVNLRHLARIRRVLVFAFIYEGAPSWASADGVVTLHPTSGPAVEVRLDDATNAGSMCAIALLTNNDNDLKVNREVAYVKGHEALDKAYSWGMTWTPGRK